MYLCWVPPWDALHGWGLGESSILHWAIPLGAQVWSQPWFGLCRAEGTDWGHGGVFAHSLHQSGRADTSGEPWLLSCRQARAPGHMEVSKFLLLLTMRHWANALREKPLQIDFLSSPSLSAFLVRHEVTWRPCPCLGCPEEPWQHHNTPRPLCHCSLMMLQWCSARAQGKWSADLGWKASAS